MSNTPPLNKRLLVVQYSGDYREAYQRLRNGQGETYMGHKYIIESLDRMGRLIGEAVVLHCYSKAIYDESLTPNLRIVSTGFEPKQSSKALVKFIEQIRPDYLVVFSPFKTILSWAVSSQIKTLAIFADSFCQKNPKQHFQNYRLKNILNSPGIDWVGNHGLNACNSLQNIGVNPEKIIPWDYPYAVSPHNYSAKHLRDCVDKWTLTYVGSVEKSKGVGDIIQTIANLKSRGYSSFLKVVGDGNVDYFRQLSQKLGVQNDIHFLGKVSNREIIDPLMRQSDLIIVPSHHSYPEGFPLTIYEALTSRTPIVASNHSMFLGNLKNKVNAMIFPEQDISALSDSIVEVMTDKTLYHQISLASESAWENLQLPVKWETLIENWLDDTGIGNQYLKGHCLNSGLYRRS